MANDIHQELTFSATPKRIYEILMSSKEHGAFTGAPAKISADVGGAFACHDGNIEGRNVELEPGKRIVQAWRAASWPAGVYSILRLSLEPEGDNTKLTLDQAGVPSDAREHIDGGWHKMYWEPLRKYL